MNETFLTIVVVIGFTIILSLISLKKKNEVWEGTLIKKRTNEDSDTDNVTYILIFKTLKGRRKRIQIDEQTYNSFRINSRYKKEKGEYLPKAV